MNGKWWLTVGAMLAMAAVALGAFGAHGLESSIKTWGLDVAEQAKRLHNWEVAVRYQMYHALALMVIGVVITIRPNRSMHIAAALLVIGVLIFSGCLYAYVFTGQKAFGMIVPIGGVAMIVGWLLFVVANARWPSNS